jgi:asparagine synthase (glutamine-hydrolysing)
MGNDDGSVVLTYNGEIYNFRELRRELEGRGHRFRSRGDTEVVVRAYEEWGDEAIARLDGMFALALFDARRGRLVLARDRTGKKPLFYAAADGRIAFGSEIRSVLLCPGVERRPDRRRIGEYLTFGYVPWPNTFYEGVDQVPPGAVVTFDREGASTPSAYWSPLPGGPALRPNGDARAEIRRLLRAAVERRLMSDVPLGALLSGGVDSSLVVAFMSELLTEPVHTFAIGFADDVSYDERSYAAQVARRFGTEHREYVVEMDAVGVLDRLVWHHDGPFADSSAIPTYAVSRIAREHVTVALNGDGGDEIFGGYDRFRAAALAVPLPGWAAQAGHRTAAMLPVDHGYYSVRRRAMRFLELADAPLEQRYMSWVGVANRELLDELVQPSLAAGDVMASMDRAYEEARDLPPLDRILYANFRTYLPDDLAVKMDRMSMAHSLETRSPFLDTALIEHLARIRARRKVGLRRVKPLLRAACRDMLPDEIWDRRKHGFGVPVGRWFRGDLGDVFTDEVLAADARSADLVRPEAVERLWREHRAEEREHGFRLWTLLTLERWLRSLDQPVSAEPPPDGVRDATPAVA